MQVAKLTGPRCWPWLRAACRALAASEARLAAAATRLQEAEAAAAAQHSQLDGMAQHLAGVEAEHAALREEYRAVTDDLAALVKENQVRARAQPLGAGPPCRCPPAAGHSGGPGARGHITCWASVEEPGPTAVPHLR